MADVKWSDNAAFPEASSINGSEELVGLKSGNNMKANIGTKLFPYIESNLLGSAINANFVSPSPVNYTPTDSSITGNLRGIDAALASAGTIPIAQQLWVNAANGIDSVARTGDINSPFASYTYALSIAVASASPTNQYLIHIIGDQTLSGNFVISPFVNVDGHNSGLITANTFLTLDTAWTSANNEIVFIKNCNFAASDGATLNFGLGLENLVYFDYCSFDGVPTLIVTANNSNSSPNDVLFQNTIFTSGSGPFQSGTAVQDALLLLKNCPINNLSVICTGSGGTFGAGAVLQNCTVSGTTQIFDSGTGANAFLSLQSSPPSNAPALSGNNAFLQSDVASYTFIPILSGTPLTNVSISSLSDGLLQTSYTPVNFTPDNTGGNYLIDSMTAMIHGIDNELSVAVGTPISFTAKLSSSATNVTGDGTPYTVIFDDVFSNNGLTYNNSTGVVTASITGQYNFEFFLNQIIGGTHNNCDISLVTTSKTYSVVSVNPGTVKNVSSNIRLGGSVLADMSAGDTAFVQLTISGGSLDSGVYGDGTSTAFTYFCGYLVRAAIGTEIIVTDDNSTNSTMYPVWVSGTSGAQDAFVSSNIFQFNPGAGPTITTTPTFSISSTGLVYSETSTSTSGSVNEAGYLLSRGDDGNGYAQFHYQTANTDLWAIGLRAGDVNYHIFNQGLDTDVLFIDSSGNINLPLLTPNTSLALDGSKNIISVTKDAFSAYANAAQTNVTGAGTVYTVQFNTQAGGPSPNYNTGTGIYTAPADGFYQFSAGVNVFNLDSGMTALKLSLLLNGTQIYVIAGNNPFAGKDASGYYIATGAVTVPMSAGDTANITLEIDGGAGNNAGIYSSTNPIFTFFTGSQL